MVLNYYSLTSAGNLFLNSLEQPSFGLNVATLSFLQANLIVNLSVKHNRKGAATRFGDMFMY